MITAFRQILSMSISASVVILAVILVRGLLIGAPKKWSYLLWSAAAFRLCCPVSLRSAVSVFSVAPSNVRLFHPVAGNQAVSVMPTTLERTLSAPVHPANQVSVVPAPGTEWMALCAWIWIVGIAVMLLLSAIRYLRLRSALLYAVQVEKRVYETDRITSPFVLGLLHPRIYLPLGVEGERRQYVLAHERYHLRRGDHWIKTFAFLILTIHWFNPLCWLAFYLMNRDMELSCDEHVLSGSADAQVDYSASLLSFAAPRQFPMPGPLAFGESDISRRVKNALRWRRPKPWVTALSLLLCAAAVTACATNPARSKENAAGDPKAFRSAVQASLDAGETVTIEYADGTTGGEISILDAMAAVDWQGITPDGVFPEGMDCITLKTDSWSLETFSGTDYVRYVPKSGEGGGWLWWELPEENREEGSLYYNLNALRELTDDWRSMDVEVDLRGSGRFSDYELEAAVAAIVQRFSQFGEGFSLQRIAWDHDGTAQELQWLNEHKDAPDAGAYTECVCFLSDFHTPPAMENTAWNLDADYTNWGWWLARIDGGDWVVVDMGY